MILLLFVYFWIELSVVNKHWLIECYLKKKRVPLNNFLVGDSIITIDLDIGESTQHTQAEMARMAEQTSEGKFSL